MVNKKIESIGQRLASLNEQELRRLLTEHLAKQKLGLVWERDAIAHDEAVNSEVVLPRLVQDLSCTGAGETKAHFQNLIIEGDNFDSLRLLRSTHANKIRVIYIDPARRDDAGNKVVSLQDCTPDVTRLQEEMLQKADFVVIKLSPMLDWHRAVSELRCVREVHVVSVNNECKELLLVLSARNMDENSRLRICCVNDTQSFVCDDAEMASSVTRIAAADLDSAQYLYEPNASLMKAGCFGVLSERYSVSMLSKNSHLFVSQFSVADFPGRSFRIRAVSSFNKKELKRHL